MKAARLYGKEDLRIEDVRVPAIGEGEVLLAVKAAAVCGTDIRMFRNGYKGVGPDTPLILGHEIAGIVEKT
ncbi:MAG: alcohol dehydrogenase catalytic domain-containing protein, partial [Spirochaetes bacterium]|nr:alcohol dehydrogenase catalytic domain-containing protein [Spirochaetota bacterium]